MCQNEGLTLLTKLCPTWDKVLSSSFSSSNWKINSPRVKLYTVIILGLIPSRPPADPFGKDTG